jgi:molecular chaperone DnaK (HSP70)
MTVVAVDFGTTNTVVGVLEPGRSPAYTVTLPQVSRNLAQATVIPSMVAILPDRHLLIGEAARVHGDTARLFRDFKRDLVAEFRSPARVVDGVAYDAEAIAGMFLGQLWRYLMPWQPSQVVFTAPVGAFAPYLRWIRQWAYSHGLPPVQVLDESTAAALTYAVTRPQAVVLVLDFGGGTLDLSLVRTAALVLGDGDFCAEVIAKSDAYLGGVDLDQWLAKDWLGQLGVTRSHLSPDAWRSLLALAEQTKIALSTAEQVQVVWEWNGTEYALGCSQEHFGQLLESQGAIARFRQAIDEVLEHAVLRGVSKAEIEQVFLVGGGCQIPCIQGLVRAYFGAERVSGDRPFDAVAHGALHLGTALTLRDYLRHRYALRLWEPALQQYLCVPIFEPGTTYPCVADQPMVLQCAHDQQTEVRLEIGEVAEQSFAEVVYDGAGRIAGQQLLRQSDFSLLGTSAVSLRPAGRLGEDRLALTWAIDAYRQLRLTVLDQRTGQLLLEQEPILKLE